MSITAYTGLPGHGKSFGVVKNVIVPAVKEFREVWTNIPLNLDEFERRYQCKPVQFDLAEVKDNPRWFLDVLPHGALLVVDECWRIWPNGVSSTRMDEAHKEFFAEHRHMVSDLRRSTEIVLVTQDLAQISNFVRSLVDTTYRVTKLSKLGMNKTFRVDVYSGAVTGSSPPKSKREREIPGRFDKDTYQLYVSHTKSDHGAGNETRADSRFNVLGGFLPKLFVSVFLLLAVLVWMGSGSVASSFGHPDEKALPADPQPVATPIGETIPDRAVVRRKNHVQSLLDSADIRIIYQSFSGFWDYVFRLEFSDSYSDLTTSELVSLGFRVQPVSQCLAVLSIDGSPDTYVGCAIQEDRGFIEGLVQGDPLSSLD